MAVQNWQPWSRRTDMQFSTAIVLATGAITIAGCVSAPSFEVSSSTAEKAVQEALPGSWGVVEKDFDSLPFAHHECDSAYSGPKGTHIVVEGPKDANSERLDGDGVPYGAPRVELWLMPAEYRYYSPGDRTCFKARPPAFSVGQWPSVAVWVYFPRYWRGPNIYWEAWRPQLEATLSRRLGPQLK